MKKNDKHELTVPEPGATLVTVPEVLDALPELPAISIKSLNVGHIGTVQTAEPRPAPITQIEKDLRDKVLEDISRQSDVTIECLGCGSLSAMRTDLSLIQVLANPKASVFSKCGPCGRGGPAASQLHRIISIGSKLINRPRMTVDAAPEPFPEVTVVCVECHSTKRARLEIQAATTYVPFKCSCVDNMASLHKVQR